MDAYRSCITHRLLSFIFRLIVNGFISHSSSPSAPRLYTTFNGGVIPQLFVRFGRFLFLFFFLIFLQYPPHFVHLPLDRDE